MIPIIAPPSAPFARVRTNATPELTRQLAEARKKGAKVDELAEFWFLDLALPALWKAALDSCIDPVVLAAQCAHETGFGTFQGRVTSKFGNTCGLKNVDAAGDRPEDHAHFAIAPNGQPVIGAIAHAHHLSLYAGMTIPEDSPDPRAKFVRNNTELFGSAPYVENLGSGRWAPGVEYGTRVASIVSRLRGMEFGGVF